MAGHPKESGLWVYKCNRKPRDFAVAYGDWVEFFAKGKEGKWGGSQSTKNNTSLNILNTRMKEGDLVLAYQTDERSLIGTCRISRLKGIHPNREIWLKPTDQFDVPIPIHDLKQESAALRNVQAFRSKGFPQTLYEVSADERRILEAICQVHLRPEPSAPVLPQQRRTGAGFGDAETNKIVEQAAVSAVRRWYRRRGWTITSRERDRCGFDLLCTKGRAAAHVEAKGVAGDTPRFIITAAEKRQAESNPCFVICVVTRATAKRPSIHRLNGTRLERAFEFTPLSFLAQRKGRSRAW